ncbi:MAG: SRPBCC family protein [Nitrospirae bacterium]|nr:SRPBCC family protein [Nitrospirota bacterium]
MKEFSVEASIEVSLDKSKVFAILSDIEKIYRLSPYREVKSIEPPVSYPLQINSQYSIKLVRYEDESELNCIMKVNELRENEFLALNISGDKTVERTYHLEDVSGKVRITQRESFMCSEEESEALSRKNLREIQFWLRSIGEYLRLYEKPTLWRKGFLCFMDRFWIPMSPSQRKISILVIKITILELFIFIGIILTLKIAGFF